MAGTRLIRVIFRINSPGANRFSQSPCMGLRKPILISCLPLTRPLKTTSAQWAGLMLFSPAFMPNSDPSVVRACSNTLLVTPAGTKRVTLML